MSCGRSEGAAFFSAVTMVGYGHSSADVVMVSPTYAVAKEDEFMLQYGDGWCQTSTADNNGTSCAEVFFLYSASLPLSADGVLAAGAPDVDDVLCSWVVPRPPRPTVPPATHPGAQPWRRSSWRRRT